MEVPPVNALHAWFQEQKLLLLNVLKIMQLLYS